MNTDIFTPTHSHCKKVWELLGSKGKQHRLNAALRRRAIIEKVNRLVKSGEFSERQAIAAIAGCHRSSYRRWKKKYEAFGLDGLIDWRMPILVAAELSEAAHAAICTLRRENPNIAVEKIVEHLATYHDVQTSTTTVKRVLREEGLSRRPGPHTGMRLGEQRLEWGGFKLLEAAEVEVGLLDAQGKAVMSLCEAAQLKAELISEEIDVSGRDELGRFLPEYNKRYHKKSDELLGPGFVSVEEKREDKDPNRFHLSGARLAVIERKLCALLYSPLLGNGRWDDLRVSRGALFEELCGFPYMPSTLDLFTRELKYLGVANTLWEIHARLWQQATAHWTHGNTQGVLYVDGTNKPVWTKLFSQASPISSVGRVMPGLELVACHNGNGVPLFITTHSGRAPLVKVVPNLLDKLDEMLEGAEVGRIVVIDAEGNSVPFLKGLEQGKRQRGWVTRLKPTLLEGKLIFDRTRYCTYRNGDKIRMGMCYLNDPSGGTFRVRIIEVKRRSKGTITTLGASTLLDVEEWAAQDIADLYFNRWPQQEANFRAVNQAVGFKDVHGYGKQLVENVSVVTEIEKIVHTLNLKEEQLGQIGIELTTVTERLKQERKSLRQLERRTATVNRHIKTEMKTLKWNNQRIKVLFSEDKKLKLAIEKQSKKVLRLEHKMSELERKINVLEETLNRKASEQEKLETRRHIYRHDVELDSLFSLMRVNLGLLVTYVLREYLGDAAMEPETFLERLATLPAWRRYVPGLEIITFEYNPRDADIMAILEENCAAINNKRLHLRSGRVLRIQVEPAPLPKRPPPINKRVMPGDRFRR